MSIGLVIIAAIMMVALIVGLFSMLTDPREVDEEEERSVEQEEKHRWWRRQ